MDAKRYEIQAFDIAQGWQTLSTCADIEPLLCSWLERSTELQHRSGYAFSRLRLVFVIRDYEIPTAVKESP